MDFDICHVMATCCAPTLWPSFSMSNVSFSTFAIKIVAPALVVYSRLLSFLQRSKIKQLYFWLDEVRRWLRHGKFECRRGGSTASPTIWIPDRKKNRFLVRFQTRWPKWGQTLTATWSSTYHELRNTGRSLQRAPFSDDVTGKTAVDSFPCHNHTNSICDISTVVKSKVSTKVILVADASPFLKLSDHDTNCKCSRFDHTRRIIVFVAIVLSAISDNINIVRGFDDHNDVLWRSTRSTVDEVSTSGLLHFATCRRHFKIQCRIAPVRWRHAWSTSRWWTEAAVWEMARPLGQVHTYAICKTANGYAIIIPTVLAFLGCRSVYTSHRI